MTKKQFKKALRSLSTTKGVRKLVWLRLFVTFLPFVAVLGAYIWSVITANTTIANADQIGEIFTQAIDLAKIEPISFFSLKTFGALGTFYWAKLLDGTGINPELMSWVGLVVGLILTFFFFKRVKKSKKNSSAYFMMFLLSVIDIVMLFACLGIPAYSEKSLMTYIAYVVNLLTIIATFNAMVKGGYLKKNFEAGLGVKRSEIKKAYRADKED